MKSKQQNPQIPNKSSYSLLTTILIVLTLIIVFVRIRFLPTPLERDEGEYAYAGQLMLQGVPPYSLAYNMKMPGIYAAYALILACFGQDQLAIHFGALIINLAVIILMYCLVKKYFDTTAAVAAAVFFAITSISNTVRATANAENFVLPFAIIGIFLLMKYIDSRKIFLLVLSGLSLGTGFMMKQHGAAFILFGAIYILYNGLWTERTLSKRLIGEMVLYSSCAVLPFLGTCLILWRCGVFEKFWFWTFDYARHYVTLTSWNDGFVNFRHALMPIVRSGVLIWLAGLAGFLIIITKKQFGPHRFFVIGFTICSFLALCPGLYFRPHYFVLFLPALAILAGIGTATLPDLLKLKANRPVAAALLILLIWFQSFYSQRKYLTESNPEILSRMVFGFFPFPETFEIARYIKANSCADDKILVFGSEPQIYFYAQRRSAASFIYTYPLMENQPFALDMQKEMISQAEAAKPAFIVIVKTADSWMPQPNAPKLIFNWIDNYISQYYQQTGLVEIFEDKQQSVYYFDQARQPEKSEGWLMIFKRRENAG